MSKHVLVISSSLRPGGNSEALAEAFARGAERAGHAVETISLRGKTIGFCTGCLVCQQTGRCVIHDDADAIAQKMLTSDIIAFATPIYFYEMSGQMKAMLDRSNPLFPTDYAFRDIYLLAAAADDEESAIDGAVNGLRGWIECFEKTSLKGVVRGTGMTETGEAKGSPALQAAYAMGRTL